MISLDDLTGQQNEGRRARSPGTSSSDGRGDIRAYPDEETTVSLNRREEEAYYELSQPHRRLFDSVLDYARETVLDPEENRHRQRVRWWSALALLRSLASSPAAASTLRNRAATVDTETPEEADEVGRRTVLDLEDDVSDDYSDFAPGAQIEEAAGDAQKQHHDRLLRMACQAEALEGDDDQKMIQAVKYVQDLIKDGFSPIVFWPILSQPPTTWRNSCASDGLHG
ncbi:MAG: hypothetical protein R3A46_12675 [Thermomicrobiales bacterium]